MGRIIAFFLILIFIYLYSGITQEVYAKNDASSGIAVYIQIADKNVQEGDIITIGTKGYMLGSVPYDPNIFGVVVKNPALAFEDSNAGSRPVISHGKVYLRVSTMNGNIKKGDLVTTSTVPGVGQKATENGFIIATALEDFSAKSPREVGKILVVLDVGHGSISNERQNNLVKSLSFSLSAPYLSPLSILRYLFAAVMVIVSFLIAVVYFGRISSLGIEALGRNPLAGKLITFGIVLHVLLAIVVLGVGVVVAYLVLVI